MNRSRSVQAGLAALLALLCAVVGVNAYLLTRHERPTEVRAAPARPHATPSALNGAAAAPSAPATGPSGAVPSAAAVRKALRPALAARGLGGRVRASVVDLSTGHVLYASGAGAPAAPASTAKLLTAAAVLSVRPPSYRIPTVVRTASRGTLVLVGGGDPTLTGAAPGHAGAYPDAARISDLARQITSGHLAVRRIVVDDALFTGPEVSPHWANDDVPSSYASAITAVMADGGRDAPADVIRSTHPDLSAGRELAAALGHPGLPVSVTHHAVTGSGQVVARVQSPPLSELVEQMLGPSDNVIAECLARQVAIARGLPASFTGSAAAVRQVLGARGVDVGRGMTDGSGLAAGDRLTTGTLTAVLRLIAVTGPADLRDVVAALPVAGWSGTLDDRYVTGSSTAGAGQVRAKTGTLTGVSSLAGLLHDAGGRTLAFAFIADRVRSTPAAESGLDDLATRLVRCTCGP